VDLAIDTEPDQDDPASDEGSAWTREQQAAGANGDAPSAFRPAPMIAPDEAATSEPEGGPEPGADPAPALAAAAVRPDAESAGPA